VIGIDADAMSVAPSGWTELISSNNLYVNEWVGWRVLDGTEDYDVTVDFTLDAFDGIETFMAVIAGVDTSSPIHQTGEYTAGGVASQSGGNSLTSAADNVLALIGCIVYTDPFTGYKTGEYAQFIRSGDNSPGNVSNGAISRIVDPSGTDYSSNAADGLWTWASDERVNWTVSFNPASTGGDVLTSVAKINNIADGSIAKVGGIAMASLAKMNGRS